MDGVAIGADYVLLRVHATADVGPRNSLRMAPETGVQSLFRTDFGERNDGRLAAFGFDVGFSRAVAAFAAGVFRGFGAACDALVVRITEKLVIDRRVARFAGLAADIVRGGRKCGQEQGG